MYEFFKLNYVLFVTFYCYIEARYIVSRDCINAMRTFVQLKMN